MPGAVAQADDDAGGVVDGDGDGDGDVDPLGLVGGVGAGSADGDPLSQAVRPAAATLARPAPRNVRRVGACTRSWCGRPPTPTTCRAVFV
jgi:hypothetical protein